MYLITTTVTWKMKLHNQILLHLEKHIIRVENEAFTLHLEKNLIWGCVNIVPYTSTHTHVCVYILCLLSVIPSGM